MSPVELRQRPDLIAASRPGFDQPPASARPPGSARHVEPLGVSPGHDVAHLSQLAQALLGPEAVTIQADLAVPDNGRRFDARA